MTKQRYALVYANGEVLSKHSTPTAMGRAQRKVLNRDWNTGQTLQAKLITACGMREIAEESPEWIQYRLAVNS